MTTKEYFSFIVLVATTAERATEKSSGSKKQKNGVSHSMYDFKEILQVDASNLRWELCSCVNRCSPCSRSYKKPGEYRVDS